MDFSGFTKEELIAMNALFKYVTNDMYHNFQQRGIMLSDEVVNGVCSLRSKIKHDISLKQHEEDGE